MHAVIRKYVASPEVLAEARPKLAHLEQTMRGTPGFLAYYFLSTDDGIATITVTEDETGTSESMERAARWVQENLQTRATLGPPEVTTGQALISAIRAATPLQDTIAEGQGLAARGADEQHARGWRDGQRFGEALGHLCGGAPLIRLDFANRRRRNTDTPAQVGLGHLKRTAAALKPTLVVFVVVTTSRPTTSRPARTFFS